MEQALIDMAQAQGWEYEQGFGTSGVFICLCGERIEQDGACEECGPSPLVRQGMI